MCSLPFVRRICHAISCLASSSWIGSLGGAACFCQATERWERWAAVERGSDEYKRLKEERSQFLWRALERIIPDIRERSVVARVGTPLTHRHFLNVHRGSYGPAIRADMGQAFPGAATPFPGLLQCGDATFPGIGVPAVAASGSIAANSAVGLESLGRHLDLLDKITARP